MTVLARTLGWLVLLLGVGVAAVAGGLVLGDEGFREVAAAYERHPEHALFRAEYLAAAVRHYGLMTASVLGLLTGAVLGTTLLALSELLRRLPPRNG